MLQVTTQVWVDVVNEWRFVGHDASFKAHLVARTRPHPGQKSPDGWVPRNSLRGGARL